MDLKVRKRGGLIPTLTVSGELHSAWRWQFRGRRAGTCPNRASRQDPWSRPSEADRERGSLPGCGGRGPRAPAHDRGQLHRRECARLVPPVRDGAVFSHQTRSALDGGLAGLLGNGPSSSCPRTAPRCGSLRRRSRSRSRSTPPGSRADAPGPTDPTSLSQTLPSTGCPSPTLPVRDRHGPLRALHLALRRLGRHAPRQEPAGRSTRRRRAESDPDGLRAMRSSAVSSSRTSAAWSSSTAYATQTKAAPCRRMASGGGAGSRSAVRRGESGSTTAGTQDGLVRFNLAGKRMRTLSGDFDEFARAFSIPDYFGALGLFIGRAGPRATADSSCSRPSRPRK